MKRNPSRAFVFAAALAMSCAAWAAPDYYRASPASGKYATALALNDAGRYGINSTAPDVPYYLASIGGGGMSESLGSLGGDVTRIWALNNAGEAVGDSSTPTGEFHAFLYSAGRMHDLRARYGFANPVAINDRGQILARSCDRAGVFCYDTVLLDPVPAVPEPAHWTTLAAGLAVLGAARWSRVRAGR